MTAELERVSIVAGAPLLRPWPSAVSVIATSPPEAFEKVTVRWTGGPLCGQRKSPTPIVAGVATTVCASADGTSTRPAP